jgi:UDP-N-acetylglucosamine enolpyruvyl transferase
VRLRGIPEITDVKKILEIFRTLGSHVEVDFEARVLDVHHLHTRFDEGEHRLPEEMRSSIMLVPGCWRASAWRASRTTSRAAAWACARSTRTSR